MIFWIIIITFIAISSVIVIEKIKTPSELYFLYSQVLMYLIYDKHNIWDKGHFNNHGICAKIIILKNKKRISIKEYDIIMAHFHSLPHNWNNIIMFEQKIWRGYLFPCNKEGNLQRIEYVKKIMNKLKN